MNITVHVYHHFADGSRELLGEIKQGVKKIMATQDEVIAQLAALKAQVEKSEAEERALIVTMTQQITDLQALVNAGGDAKPELVDMVNGLAGSIQQLDDINQDAAPVDNA